MIANQFIGESVLLLIWHSTHGLACRAIAELALPTFNNLARQSLSMSDGLSTHNTLPGGSFGLIGFGPGVGIISRGLSRLCAFIPIATNPGNHNEPIGYPDQTRWQSFCEKRIGHLSVCPIHIAFIISHLDDRARTTRIFANQTTWGMTNRTRCRHSDFHELRRENKTLPIVFRVCATV